MSGKSRLRLPSNHIGLLTCTARAHSISASRPICLIELLVCWYIYKGTQEKNDIILNNNNTVNHNGVATQHHSDNHKAEFPKDQRWQPGACVSCVLHNK